MKIFKKTKIIATIGPASNDVNIIVKMIKSGLNIARINFSHENGNSALPMFKNLKIAEKKSGKILGILQDLSGPKIRTGEFKNNQAILKKGQKIKIFSKKILGDEKQFSIVYKNLLKDLKIGHRILLNDGKQELKVLRKTKSFLETKVIVGGFIRSKRGVNLIDSNLSISALTLKDKEDIKFGIKHNVDFVAFSFVKEAEDVIELRNILNKAKSKAMIISKIETSSSVKNFDKILEVSDGIMVARGDLSVEIGAKKVPVLQKDIIRKCNAVGKPVIVATQMMDSMIESSIPTRAEVSDITNAILDGTDALMLSEETAMGKYPLKTIFTMNEIVIEAEKNIKYNDFIKREYDYKSQNIILSEDAITRYAAKTARDVNADAIIVLTETGKTARMVSRYKPIQPVFLMSYHEETLRRSSIFFGSYRGKRIKFKKITEAIEESRKWILINKKIKKGKLVVLVAGLPFGTVGGTNTITVFKV